MNGNQLKILALATMTVDHVGVIFFPDVLWLRVVGRLAFPIFAYMVAEGCFHTRSRKRYLGTVVLAGVVCQVVYLCALGSLAQSIFTTLALGILTVYAFQWWVDGAPCDGGRRQLLSTRACVPAGMVVLDALVCIPLPALLAGTGFSIDYGFCGAVLPLLCYLPRFYVAMRTDDGVALRGPRTAPDGQASEATATELAQVERVRRRAALAFAAAGLVALSLSMLHALHGVQWCSLLALVPIALYDGTRGKLRLKYLFYVYYPAHLAALWGLKTLVG